MKILFHPLFVSFANLSIAFGLLNSLAGFFSIIISIAYTFWKWHKDSNDKKLKE